MTFKDLIFFTGFVCCLTFGTAHAQAADNQEPHGNNSQGSPNIVLETNHGEIEIALFPKKAPESVRNFVEYVKSEFYDGTIFHRVIDGFMIQGGGFTKTMTRKETRAPIVNEANPFVPNKRGTIAMARTQNPNSATSQFFINVVNNSFLNKSGSNPGYAVFGRVVRGMDVVDRIAKSQTTTRQGMQNVPTQNVVIQKARVSSMPATTEQ